MGSLGSLGYGKVVLVPRIEVEMKRGDQEAEVEATEAKVCPENSFSSCMGCTLVTEIDFPVSLFASTLAPGSFQHHIVEALGPSGNCGARFCTSEAVLRFANDSAQGVWDSLE